MGLFDFLKKSEDRDKAMNPRELARLTRVVGSKLSQDYDRQEAIQTLSQMANADGARALLKRFDFIMDPSITDREEKEAAAAGIAAAGKAALVPLRNYCASAESLAWPLKIIRQVVEESAYVDELLELLEQFDTEYVRNSEPKIQLINALEEFPREDVRLAIEPFMSDVNEGVRFHAVGTVFAMNDPAAIGALVDALCREESLRVKNRTASGVQQRGWEIPEALRERCAKALPDTFELKAGKLLRLG
jgi:hypothetical protein